MGSLVWKGASGDWSDAANWTVVSGTDTVPKAGDDVTINAPGSYVVTISSAEAVGNLTINAASAELDLSGALTVGGTMSDPNGVVQLGTGGAVQGGTLDVGAGGGLTLEGGTLAHTKVVALAGNTTIDGGLFDGVIWQGAMVVNGTVNVEDGLTLEGTSNSSPGALDLTAGTFNFLDSTTLDNAEVNYLGFFAPSTDPINIAAGAVLTLGPSVTLSSGGVQDATIDGPGVLVNNGTFEAPSIPGGLVFNTDVVNNGSMTIGFSVEFTGDLTNNGNIGPVKNFTSLTVDQNLLGTGAITLEALGPIPAGHLQVDGAIEGNMNIVGPTGVGTGTITENGVFSMDAGTIQPGVTITNFFVGSTIELSGVQYEGTLTAVNYVNGLLTVTENGTVADLFHVYGLPNDAVFDLAADTNKNGQGGTDITTTVPNTACFRSGTRIRSARGEVEVEHLQVGDLVPVVRAGGMLPIVWIGRRRLDIDRQPRKSDLYPVRVAAGAFADFVPTRDLWLSPEHAVFLHGVLVPVRHLINGTTITQEPCSEVTYWHVELPSHDLLLSEGAWSESYLDMGNRSAFENADVAVDLHPDFSREAWQAGACQQQERGGPVVEAIRQALDARAAVLLAKAA